MTKRDASVRGRFAAWRLVVPSLLGLCVFFLPLPLFGHTSIPLDLIVTGLRENLPRACAWAALAMVIAGALMPWLDGSWRRDRFNVALSVLKLLAPLPAAMAISGHGPGFLMAPEMVPFLFNKLVIPVGLIVPVGGLLLSLLVDYGLLQLVGTLAEPLMRPVWRTPGRSAIDAVASFVGSYSIGLLITNRVYVAGQYTARQAAIIATGFSTVSVTFMVIVARTLDLMAHWNLFFWSTLLVTVTVTAVTVRLPPLSDMPDSAGGRDTGPSGAARFKAAWRAGLEQAARSGGIAGNMGRTFLEGLRMALAILPSIMSVGLLGLLAARYTQLFDWLGFLIFPFTWLTGLSGPLHAAVATATGLAEMFLPSLLVTDADFVTRFTVGLVSISSILFFSASIPCILATRIPITVPQLLAVWAQRVALSLLLAAPVAHLAAWLGAG